MHSTNLQKYSNRQNNASVVGTHSEDQWEKKRQPNTERGGKKENKKNYSNNDII